MSGVDAAIVDYARLRHFVVSLDELSGLGISRHAIATRLRDGRLGHLHRGVFAVGPGPVSLRGRWRAATLAALPPAFLSHLHAAALADLAKPPHGPVDVLTREWLPNRSGICFHSCPALTANEVRTVDGIPTTSLPRTLLDVASLGNELQLRRIYERAEELQVLDVDAVRRELDLRRGHRGAGRLRALLAYDPTAAAAAVSELERLYLDLLRDFDLPTPQVNVLVDGYLVDCYWPEANLVVELDGYEFHGDRETFERDREKLANLRRAGHEAIAFTHRQVTGRPEWVALTTRAFVAT